MLKMLKSIIENNIIFIEFALNIILIILCFLFSGCSYFSDIYKPTIISDQKVLSSRKSQIQIGKESIIGIATYLNNVMPDIYNNGEYFFLELFSEIDIPIMFMDFSIVNNASFKWIREVNSNDFDEVITTDNKWSKAYLIAFNKVREQDKKNMKLYIDIANIGSMYFDFTYKVLENKF